MSGRQNLQAKFTQGDILRHITVMTFSGTVGLISLFLVDLVDTFFLSLMDNVAIIAAVALTLRRRSGGHRQNPAMQVRVRSEERLRIVKMKPETRQGG